MTKSDKTGKAGMPGTVHNEISMMDFAKVIENMDPQWVSQLKLLLEAATNIEVLPWSVDRDLSIRIRGYRNRN